MGSPAGSVGRAVSHRSGCRHSTALAVRRHSRKGQPARERAMEYLPLGTNDDSDPQDRFLGPGSTGAAPVCCAGHTSWVPRLWTPPRLMAPRPRWRGTSANCGTSTSSPPRSRRPTWPMTTCCPTPDASLERLETDRIDLYQVHHPNPDIPIPETMRAMRQLVSDGQACGSWGVSNYSVDDMKESQDALGDVSAGGQPGALQPGRSPDRGTPSCRIARNTGSP